MKFFWKNFGIWAFLILGAIARSIVKVINIIKNSDEISEIFSAWDFYLYGCIAIFGIIFYIPSLFFVEDEENKE